MGWNPEEGEESDEDLDPEEELRLRKIINRGAVLSLTKNLANYNRSKYSLK